MDVSGKVMVITGGAQGIGYSIAQHFAKQKVKLVIGDVKNSTYFATVFLENHGIERTVDARPSDAISLALRTHAPIYVTSDVVARRSTANLESWLTKLDDNNINNNTQEVRES